MVSASVIRLSLDIDPHIAAGCDERFTADEVSEAGGLSELIAAYRDHHAERIADIHGVSETEVFEADPERFVDVASLEFDED